MWKKKLGLTPEEQKEQERLERSRRNIESTYRCGSRTGSRKRIKVAPCVTTVMPGYDAREALDGTGEDADE